MASSTQWTWVWVNSGNWWWTGRPGVLQSVGSQRVGHDWATELTMAQMPDLSCTLAWLGLWEAWDPWREEQSLFEWTTTDHRGKELSKEAEPAHCRRSGVVKQSQRGWGQGNYFAVEIKPNGLTGFIQEPVGRCNWSASKWCLGLKVWNWAEAAQNNSDVYFISPGEVTGSRLTHSIRTILPF